MRIPRVFVDLPLCVGSELTLPANPTRHLIQVLRLSTGAQLVLFNGDGQDYLARLIQAGRDAPRVTIEGMSEPEPPAPLRIHLAIGISRGERMDYGLQKAVELGIFRISPLLTERSLVRLDGSRLERRLEHWRGVLIGACEQSGRRRLPTLDAPIHLDDWLATDPGGGLLLDPQASRALATLPPPQTEVTLLVGPEGGLSPEERQRAQNRGFLGVRLGPRILRTETAPLAAIAVMQALWGDFRDPPARDDFETLSI